MLPSDYLDTAVANGWQWFRNNHNSDATLYSFLKPGWDAYTVLNAEWLSVERRWRWTLNVFTRLGNSIDSRHIKPADVEKTLAG